MLYDNYLLKLLFNNILQVLRVIIPNEIKDQFYVTGLY